MHQLYLLLLIGTSDHYQVRPGLWAGRASLVAQRVKSLPAMRQTQVWSLGWEDPLEKEMCWKHEALGIAPMPIRVRSSGSIVSCGCCKESLQTSWLNATKMYSLIVLEVRSPKSGWRFKLGSIRFNWVEARVSTELHILWSSWEVVSTPFLASGAACLAFCSRAASLCLSDPTLHGLLGSVWTLSLTSLTRHCGCREGQSGNPGRSPTSRSLILGLPRGLNGKESPCQHRRHGRIRSLIWEDPLCHRETKLLSHNCWACGAATIEARMP